MLFALSHSCTSERSSWIRNRVRWVTLSRFRVSGTRTLRSCASVFFTWSPLVVLIRFAVAHRFLKIVFKVRVLRMKYPWFSCFLIFPLSFAFLFTRLCCVWPIHWCYHFLMVSIVFSSSLFSVSLVVMCSIQLIFSIFLRMSIAYASPIFGDLTLQAATVFSAQPDWNFQPVWGVCTWGLKQD